MPSMGDCLREAMERMTERSESGSDLGCHHYDFRYESLTVDATGIGVKFGRDSGVADAVDKDGKSVSGCVGSQRAA